MKATSILLIALAIITGIVCLASYPATQEFINNSLVEVNGVQG
jgi:hypothetical protein